MLSQQQSSFLIIGAMSGTSLDGLDLVAVRFTYLNEKWSFSIEKTETISYPVTLLDQLKAAIRSTDQEIKQLDFALGKYIGSAISSFCKSIRGHVDFVASHGHTIFHNPEEGYTLQIGDGRLLSEQCGLPVINNFRENDVKLGGQGAPLVPIGDRDLFGNYDYCLNLGGIANISSQSDQKSITAFDICPFNMGLNYLANQINRDYDHNGKLASEGKVDESTLAELNSLAYLEKAAPKSLGYEDFVAHWLPIIKDSKISTQDLMATYSEHSATQIASEINKGKEPSKVLVTGGGAFHLQFISRLSDLSIAEICVPNDSIVNFKEALVFAYLGLLRYLEKPNCLASVTGAKHDNMGGDMYGF
ncbi:anhydro-N-acetylmuramic acid kinase [Roseivirga sp.]|uniref:anhydro-N-acetylmuramic acid kinase n=1 Tax=Roseivirga sp. TaxID=1964215 RepID=UPI003B8BC57F